MKLPRTSSLALIALGLIIPTAAARLARSAAGAGYTAITHTDPPRNPEHPQVSWKEAILWTVFSGAVGGLAQLVARRWLARKTPVPTVGLDMSRKVRSLF
jgi:hypothetical protein